MNFLPLCEFFHKYLTLKTIHVTLKIVFMYVSFVLGGIGMKSTGIVRKLDELGRITLPIELRRNLDVNERDPLEIFVDDDKIILKKYDPSDIFTGDMEDLVEYKGKKVSKNSIKELARLAGFTISE